MNEERATIRVQINGDEREIHAGGTLVELLASLGLPPQAALVEYNGRALLRDEWQNVSLADGDQLEVLRVVAGG